MRTRHLAFLLFPAVLWSQSRTSADLREVKRLSTDAFYRNDGALAREVQARCEALLGRDPLDHGVRYWLAYNHSTLLGTIQPQEYTKEASRRLLREAQRHLERLAATRGFEAEAQVLLARLCRHECRVEPAKVQALLPRYQECLDKAGSLDPDNPRLCLLQGQLLEAVPASQGDFTSQAMDAFRKGIRLAEKRRETDGGMPDWGLLDCRAALGRACERIGRLYEARRHFEQVLAVRPDFAQVAAEDLPALERRLGLTRTAPSADLEQVLAREKAMEALGLERGMRAAYLAYLVPEAVGFRQGPVPVRPIHEHKPVNWPVSCRWTPELADISAAGDLAFTFGPVQVFENRRASRPAGCEHHLGLWKRQADGSWKQVFDAGVSHEIVDLAIHRVLFPARRGPAVHGDPGRESAALLALDRQFDDLVKIKGLAGAYASLVAENVFLCQDGAFPRIGKESVEAHVQGLPGMWTWKPMAGVVAASGDLAYTYGTFDREFPEGTKSSSYVRVWKRGQGQDWKLFLEMCVPFTATKS